jgi:uncharacterized protein (DUF302 family)
MTTFTLSRTLPLPYAEAVVRVREALAEQGFGVLTEIDLAATLKAKLDVDLAPEVILGACRPQLAHAAIQVEPSVAALLPCNVVVRAVGDTTTLVEVFDPSAMMALAGSNALDSVAAEAGQRVAAMLDHLGRLEPADSPDVLTRRA